MVPGVNTDGLVVLFIAHPGLGKTDICEKLPASLPSCFSVQQQLNKKNQSSRGWKYWQQAAQAASVPRGDGIRTVVLAHQSLVNLSLIHISEPTRPY